VSRDVHDKAAEEKPTEIEPPFNDEIPDFDEELIPWRSRSSDARILRLKK
jgi:hypothetical protein